MGKHRKFTAEFKTKVILEVLSERSTLRELSQHYELHPNIIGQWKKQFLEHAPAVFSGENGETEHSDRKELEKENQRLYQKIGKLQVEIDFLKKVLS